MIPATLHPQEHDRQTTVDELELANPLFVDCYDSIVRLMQAATQVPICLFSILDGDRQFFKACEGLDARETSRDQAFCAHAIVQDDLNQAFVVSDATADPRFVDNPLVIGPPHIRFYAGVPIRAPNGLPVGTLCLIDTEPREFNPAMSDLLGHGRKLLEDQLRLFAAAIRDPLTGLYNRRFLDDAMEREWRSSYRQLLPLSVMVLDIDHFKKYNDHYGHSAGDDAIMAVGNCLKAACHRPSDVVVRYGGEEFLVVLPETDLNGAKLMADRLVCAVSALGIRHAQSPVEFLTVSVGAAVVQTPLALDQGYRQVILVADAALYAAKDSGRNMAKVVDYEEQNKLLIQTILQQE